MPFKRPQLRRHVDNALDFIGAAFMLALMYFAVCFLVAAYLAVLMGGDWMAAGIANIKNHWEMWTRWLG